jgi:hypothetical protein
MTALLCLLHCARHVHCAFSGYFWVFRLSYWTCPSVKLARIPVELTEPKSIKQNCPSSRSCRLAVQMSALPAAKQRYGEYG